jgi:hypothetical protein
LAISLWTSISKLDPVLRHIPPVLLPAVVGIYVVAADRRQIQLRHHSASSKFGQRNTFVQLLLRPGVTTTVSPIRVAWNNIGRVRVGPEWRIPPRWSLATR